MVASLQLPLDQNWVLKLSQSSMLGKPSRPFTEEGQNLSPLANQSNAYAYAGPKLSRNMLIPSEITQICWIGEYLLGSACTYFSLHSQFMRTTVIRAFFLLAVLLSSAYGWKKM